VAREWLFGKHPPDPAPGSIPVAKPAPARPRIAPVEPGPDGARAPWEIRLTWIGHATFLIQLPGLNLLTDPVWSDRSSPIGFAGPRRFVPPPIALDELPEIHAVLLSHDHYDHLDRPTVRALHRRFGGALTWLAPLGHRVWLEGQGIARVEELDWWESASLPGTEYAGVCVPARHWTRRRPRGTDRRLWCGWVVVPSGTAAAEANEADDRRGRPSGPRIWFAGDTASCPAFAEIGARLGPFDASLLPIGAYEPRWFMSAWHVNPEEAVRAWVDAGASGAFVGMHWGTWRLTFEDPLEPPVRTRAAWKTAGLPEDHLYLPRHGETLVLTEGTGR